MNYQEQLNKSIKRTFFKGDKYIFYLMALKLCQRDKKKTAIIGDDNGMKGGQNYYRIFTLSNYQGRDILTEKKYNSGFADFSRSVEILSIESKTPAILPYIENGESRYKWNH